MKNLTKIVTRIKFFLVLSGLALALILSFKYEETPYLISKLNRIPTCYIYMNAHILILLALLIEQKSIQKFLLVVGLSVGIIVSTCFLFFTILSKSLYLFSSILFGCRTIFFEFGIFFALWFLSIFKEK